MRSRPELTTKKDCPDLCRALLQAQLIPCQFLLKTQSADSELLEEGGGRERAVSHQVMCTV